MRAFNFFNGALHNAPSRNVFATDMVRNSTNAYVSESRPLHQYKLPWDSYRRYAYW